MAGAGSVSEDGDTQGTRRDRWPVGLLVSLALHAAFVLALLLAPPTRPNAPEEPGIAVEIVPPSEALANPSAAFSATPPAAPPDAAPQSRPTAPPTAPGAPKPHLAPSPSRPPATAVPTPDTPSAPADTIPPGWTAADKLVSAQRLAEPRNRAVAKHIAAMPADLRDEQLCDFEAVEQASKPGKVADQAIAYAFSEPKQAPGEITAEGAAVRIAGQWYQFAFRCRTAGMPAAVTAFVYRLGKPIPRRLWAEYGLAAGGDD